MLGMEQQPFLVEAFIGHVYASDFTVPVGYENSGNNLVFDDHPQSTIVIVQIANPFDRVLDLNGFRLRVFFDGSSGEVDLTPHGMVNPGSAKTFYAIENQLAGENLEPRWVNALGLDDAFANAHNVTAVLGPAGANGWSTDRNDYDTGDEKRAIEIVRMIPPFVGGPAVAVVLDRIDLISEDNTVFGSAVTDMDYMATGSCELEPPEGDPWPNVMSIGTDTHWIEWVHVTRAWDVDINSNGVIEPDEKNPRYVFGLRDVDMAQVDGESYDSLLDPNIWFSAPPARFETSDKRYYADNDLNFAMQMLQKDGDFEQVGELLNVWLFGHELEFDVGDVYKETVQTFSEFMSDSAKGPHVNRLQPGQIIGNSQLEPSDPQYLFDPLHAVPALPAGLRVLDAFVCDGIGVNSGGAGEFLNANGFSGKMTPGLININTAPVEVMRALPHMTRMVHEANSPSDNLYVRIPEAIVQYRERFNGISPMDPNYLLYSTGIPSGANYSGRAGGLRPERGLASIGELTLLTKPAQFVPPLPLLEPNENWQVDFAALRPLVVGGAGGVESTQISTDVNDVFDPMGDVPDQVAQDVEEQNLLFAGISNLITTRSDMFTVYFKIRSFRQNRVTGIWDATDPEYIVDDSRYVMLVDRSEVNRPTDKPKILYLEKLPK
ncbi:MAG: hypothetical protein O6941_08795 [Planctomycetota bacterium]|nr:hypothetical protein [Planctomycetota bacterium]